MIEKNEKAAPALVTAAARVAARRALLQARAAQGLGPAQPPRRGRRRRPWVELVELPSKIS
jgi:hypothetical protein